MNLILFFTSIYLFNCAFGEATESEDMKKRVPGFIFTYPRTFLAGKRENVCLTLYEATLPTKVLIDLKVREKHHTSIHVMDTEYSCFEMEIPERKKQASASLHLQIELNGTIHTSHNQEPILIYPMTDVTFIETDRNLYKLNDKVKIRILVLRHDLKAHDNYTIHKVKIINPGGVTVAVWENLQTELGLTQIELQLAEDTMMGKWKIETNGETKIFQVKRYVLPRFKVTLHHPKTIYGGSDNHTFTVCGRYSYGKPVKGVGLVKLSYPNAALESISKINELTDGCVTFEMTSDELRLKDVLYKDWTLHIVGTITEEGTNKIEMDFGKIQVVKNHYFLEFSKEHAYFQSGLPYKGKLKITDPHKPLTDEHVQICYNIAVKKTWNIKQSICKNFTFDADNVIHFDLLPMKENVVAMTLYAKALNHTEDVVFTSLYLSRWYSPSNSFIQIERNNKLHYACGSTMQFIVHYTSDKFKQNENVNFYYMLKSRNEILKIGKITHSPRRQTVNYNDLKHVIGTHNKFTQIEIPVDNFTLKFKLDKNIISKSQLVVYYMLKNEIVAASIDIHVEKCLYNSVDAKWSDNKLYPGEIATFNIETDAMSLCTLSSVDKSSTFLSNSKPLNIHNILAPFAQDRPAPFSYKLNCLFKKKPENITTNNYFDLRRRKRYHNLMNSRDLDTFEVFNYMGLAVISNLKIITKPCEKLSMVFDGDSPEFSSSLQTPTRIVEYDVEHEERGNSIRSFFPETWLWELVPVGQDGSVKLSRQLPDTITNWVTNTLCVSPSRGVGMSNPNEIKAFKPFFIDVLLPYSIKREEILHMSVIIFNYMNHSLPIRVTLGDTKHLVLVDNNDKKIISLCVHSETSSSHTFRIKGTKLGRINLSVLAEIESTFPGECGPEVLVNKRDLIYKTIFVEPEGYPNEIIKSTLLCSNSTLSGNNVTWKLILPQDVVSDSPIAKILFNADLLGPTIENLENLLAVPIGCGEQIMATLAPNLYVLEYIKSTGKMASVTLQRALRNLKIGYQRILDYAHKDGSFSAFGYHDTSGSMFLTAFVVRTLQQAKKYIFVDENVITRAVRWITEHQLENGCFSAVSHVFQDMGGTSTENSTAALTAYVVISLMESNIVLPETVLMNAKFCIRGHHQPDKYTLSISTYALYLADWHSEADRRLQKLLEVATQEGNLMWWSHMGLSPAVSVEMTSYVLMSLLYKNSTDSLVFASSIVRWLSTQRSTQGGFQTTQDTAVALDAISRYARLVKQEDPNLNITVTTYSQTNELQVNANDRLKTKQVLLNDVPKDVKIYVEGEGCILVQAVITFNVNHLSNSEAFKLAVDVEAVSTIDRCSVAVISPCISYTGPGLQSNMAVLEVTMPSGYEPDRASLYQLTSEDDTKVKKFEELKNRVVLYFTQLNNEPVCVPFNINENTIVENLLNTTIKLYDYYRPEMSITKMYKVNTCQPNEVAPIPSLPGQANGTKSLNDSTEENTTIIQTVAEITDKNNLNVSFNNNITKRETYQNELIANFIDLDVDMVTPDGLEGNIPYYVKPNANNRTENQNKGR